LQNIIFDLGNTLLYFDFCYFYDRIAEREKNLNPAAMKKFIHLNRFDIKLMKGNLRHKDFFRIIKKKFNLKIGYSDFIFFYSDVFWANAPMKNFLEKIERVKKFRLFLLSNTDTVHINFIDKNFPFVRLLKKRVLSYKVRSVKPQKVIFKHTLRKFRLKAQETLLIDDMKENIESAAELGINGIHYRNHKSFLKQFSALVKKLDKK